MPIIDRGLFDYVQNEGLRLVGIGKNTISKVFFCIFLYRHTKQFNSSFLNENSFCIKLKIPKCVKSQN